MNRYLSLESPESVDLKYALETPFYSNYSEHIYSYTEYDFFKLKHNLQPIVNDLYDNAYITFNTYNDYTTRYKHFVVYLKRLNVKDLIIDINDNRQLLEKSIIDISQTNHVLILPRLDLIKTGKIVLDREIDAEWYNEMMDYLPISEYYNPMITDDGLYVDLSKDTDYYSTFVNLLRNLNNNLSKMWNQGWIINPNINIENWGIKNLSGNLYRSTWTNERILEYYDNLYGLFKHLELSNELKFTFSLNNVDRHYLAKIVGNRYEFYFEDIYVVVKLNSYKESLNFISLMDEAFAKSNGKVMILTANRISWNTIYRMASKINKEDCMWYRTSDKRNPYRYSCLLSHTDDIEYSLHLMNTTVEKIVKDLNERDINFHTTIEDRGFVGV